MNRHMLADKMSISYVILTRLETTAAAWSEQRLRDASEALNVPPWIWYFDLFWQGTHTMKAKETLGDE